MTREEKQKAIDAVERLNALKQFIGYDKDSDIVKATQKSLDMAIKALEQEPCEDAVSRQSVLNLVNSDWEYEGLEKDVASLPPVTPQPKIGHWVYIGNSDFNGLKICECDACLKRTFGGHAFCPNCGAKMVESEE